MLTIWPGRINTVSSAVSGGRVGYACRTMTRATKNRPVSTLRIIAGSMRGRRIQFSAAGVRPTGDRVRETLFNWLAGRVTNARCLDLFAGSGALGIEALSRGAAEVVFVEQDALAARELRANLTELDCAHGKVVRGDAWRQPLDAFGPFDVVFLDPPFDDSQSADLCKLLETTGCLAPEALVYVEVARKTALPDLPAGWDVLRENTAGQVRYALLQRQAV